MNRDRLYQSLSKVAWSYIFLYLNINLGTISILPEWVAFLLIWQALDALEEVERDLTLLRPFCVLLGIWAGIDWAATALGLTFSFYPVMLVMQVIRLYFHFQLLTCLARMAAKYQPAGSLLSQRLLRLRTVQALLFTLSSAASRFYPTDGSEPALLLLVVLVLLSVGIALALTVALFDLRKCVHPSI